MVFREIIPDAGEKLIPAGAWNALTSGKTPGANIKADKRCLL